LSHRRWLILVLSPILVSGVALGVAKTFPRVEEPTGSNDVVTALEGPRADEPPRPTESARVPPETGAAAPAESRELEDACRDEAEDLGGRLGDDCQVIVRPPFVLAGDLSEAGLSRWYDRTIHPASQAMNASYFSVQPDEVITILLFSGEEPYNRYAKSLFGDEEVSVYGYFKPASRTLVMNIGTGGGTLVHELTHALMEFDFPKVPDWFNEGLASLHEQCQFREDGSGIDGLVNWRLPKLQEAIADGRLRSLESLISADDFRSSAQVGLNYAQARYFCMYMQEQGVLGDYYHRFRKNQKADPLGAATVLEVFPGKSWQDLDEEFREWVRTLEWGG
jgi:hypothetical protein